MRPFKEAAKWQHRKPLFRAIIRDDDAAPPQCSAALSYSSPVVVRYGLDSNRLLLVIGEDDSQAAGA
jgi:hypothetical protein